MKLKLAFSTCPNDTFMFEAIVNKRVDTLNYDFELTLADIDLLNKLTSNNEADIAKISFNNYPLISKNYQLLRSGSAIGFGNGPMIISKHKIELNELKYKKIAIPGENTTANLLLKRLFPDIRTKKVYLFSDIERAILENEVDAGLIIHETRFTYKQRGLQQIADLGHEWEKQTGLPLPLGGIVIRRDLSEKVKTDIQQIMQESVKYATNNPEMSMPYVKRHAQEISDEVVNQHIDLYVNSKSIRIDSESESAINELLSISSEFNNVILNKPIFID
ncbi:MAG: menaquinone biosynthesis family protein [Salinivirgaceae bacterium]|jgi:1,4-dihydroxy-6-naphthoate synthase|nr:1,4-dihydroxy-6-naphthoate synthase [Bacteroidales bacterium]